MGHPGRPGCPICDRSAPDGEPVSAAEPAAAARAPRASTSCASPSRVIAEGSSTARTTVASISTATARPTPSCLNSSSDNVPKMLNTPTMTAAALVTTPADDVTPRATASLVGRPESCASRIRLTTKT